MKVASIHLKNFKRFHELNVDLRSPSTTDVANRFLFLGDNGTGKTTVLQAVALCLSLACKQTQSVKEFRWPGWVASRYERWGMPSIALEVRFTDDEIEATQEAAQRWFSSAAARAQGKRLIKPGRSKTVHLRLEGNALFCGPSPHALSEELLQFHGRWYASQLLADPRARSLFDRLPGVFWFDQFRTLATTPALNKDHPDESNGLESIPYDFGVARFRQHLNRWQLSHLVRAPIQRDYLQELESSYQRIFPGRSFDLPEPIYRDGVPSPEDYYFMIKEGDRNYDIEEMSAGEQSVFPMLYEFVRQQIKNSVVLIDEIDLNLHPPLAQGLLSSLPALGPGCQFLLTTHSESISSVFSRDKVYRLEGGKSCL